jgi:SPP1 gp7 family putative phage head morphogenesis protein
MTKWVATKNMRTWREAAAKSQRSRELYRLLQHEMQGPVGIQVQRLIQANAGYISSVPLDAARVLVNEVTKAQMSGARAGTITKMLRNRFPQLLKSRVMLISRTEAAKASTALTQARCEELSLDWYVWKTSEDQRVRESHRKMDGVLCSWADPPDPEALVGVKSGLGHYAAGSCPNCRCVIMPLLSIDDIGWPHRVYSNGAIHTMTKPQFKQRFSTKGMESAA